MTKKPKPLREVKEFPPMRVIFLDIDGVLVTKYQLTSRCNFGKHGFNPFSPLCVEILNKIINQTDAEIVVSSSWRCRGPRWLALCLHFSQQGIIKRPLDRTPSLGGKSPGGVYMAVQRGEEIKAWMEANDPLDGFVVLDDDSDMDAVRENFVHIAAGMEYGMSVEHMDKAVAILKGERPDAKA